MYNMALQGLEVALTSWYWGKTQTNNSCTHLQPQTLSQEKVVTRWRWSDKVASIFSMNKDFEPSIHPLLHQSIHSLHQSIHPSTLSQEGGEVWTESPWLFCEEGFPDGSIHSTHPLHPSTVSRLLGIFPKIHPFWESGASPACNFKDWLRRLDSIHNSCDVFLLLLAVKVISILIPDV